ncbi:MAG: response regulator [Bryobacteraceae bacterium]|nr:response regulator [Bryobacteraceae bacterium]
METEELDYGSLDRQILNVAMEPILIYDPATERVLAANPAACALYDRDETEIRGALMRDVTGAASLPPGVHETQHRGAAEKPVDVRVANTLIQIKGRSAIVSSVRPLTYERSLETRLADTERQYRTLFDCNPLPMWIHDAATLRIVAVNAAAIRKYGYSRDDFIGLSVQSIEMSAPDRHNRVVHRTASGKPIEVEITSEPMPYSGGACVLLLMHDITEESATRREVMKREAWYRCLMEHATGIITTIDRDGTLRYVSPSVLRLLNRTSESLVNQSVWSFIHPEDAPACQIALRDLIGESGLTAPVEFRLQDAAGEWLVFEAFGHNLLDEPAIRAIVVYGHDISRQRNVTAALTDSNDRLRLAQRAGHAGTWECCCITGKLRFSDEAASLHGVTPPFEASDVLERLHPDDEVRFRMATGMARISGSLDLEDYRVVWPDGSIHWLHSRGEVLSHSGRSCATRLLAVVTDVTARKQAEHDAAAARDEALEASRLKSQFLATVSHEIRTPMNGIIGMTGLLLDSELSPQQRADAAIIRTSALYLLDQINELLDFSSIEAGKIVLKNTTFDLHGCLSTVMDLMLPQAAARGLELELDYPDSLPRKWAGPAGRIRQIVLNYTANAIKFTERGLVRIVARTVESGLDTELRLSVVDTGPGIDMSSQLRLFSKFVQLDASTTRRQGGTGLGLAISKSLAEAMHGSVGVRSDVGKGSEFWVHLPIHPARSTPEEGQRPALQQSTTMNAQSPSWILVAEDNLVNQKVVSRLLEKRGHRVDIAANGREAVEMWSQFPYDLILMDCQMPEMDGFEACRQIRKSEAVSGTRLPIVALTAHATSQESARCLASGMDHVLTKPFQPSDLDDLLAQWLHRAPTGTTLRPSRSDLEQLPDPSLRSEVQVP